MATINSREFRPSLEQTTVLAGAARDISLAACAYEIMNKAGLHSLSDTNAAMKSDPGTAIGVTVDATSNELQIADIPPHSKGWIVVEQFGEKAQARGWHFQTQAGAAAFFGTKLVLQDSGALTIRRPSELDGGAAHYVGVGRSRMTAMTLTAL